MSILLTGASRGLGLVITRKLLEAGHTVYAVNRSYPDPLRQLAEAHPGRLHVATFDLADADAITPVLFSDFIPSDCPLQGFINNAALAYDDLVTNLQLDPLQHMFKVNTLTPMLLTRAVIRNFLLHDTPGSIVHISSISVHTGYKGLAMYAASKGALEAFSKNTAREWGERRIRSNAIVAGFMETDMSSSLSPEQKQRIYKRTALKSPTSPESVAALALHLLSPDSSSITAQSLHVDAGTL